MSPNMPPTPLKRGMSLGQQEGPEALDMWCPQARGCLWQRKSCMDACSETWEGGGRNSRTRR